MAAKERDGVPKSLYKNISSNNRYMIEIIIGPCTEYIAEDAMMNIQEYIDEKYSIIGAAACVMKIYDD